jgi:Polyketide cyclase / dehydrase and lipid transport
VSEVTASATRSVSAPAERVLAILRDYHLRAQILPDSYSRVEVDEDGSVLSYRFSSPGRERDFRLRAQPSESGLTERDELSSYVQTWTVTDTVTGSTVTVEAAWDGSGGVGGLFERLFAPLGLRRVFSEMLERLAAASAE